MWTAISLGLATLAILLIAAGLFFASNRRRHVPLMMAAFACDMVSLVLVEVVIPMTSGTRDPVTGLLHTDEGWGMRVVHAAFATASVVGYGVAIYTGRRLLRADRSVLGMHHKNARFFLVTRGLAYVTMWML